MAQVPAKINLADLGQMETPKTSRIDRIRFRLKSLMPVLHELDSFQTNFVISLNTQFKERGDLSNAQLKVLLSIWQDAHSCGLVKLPKGMF